MHKKLVAALMAAVAMLPGIAAAQDGRGRDGGRGQARAERAQQRAAPVARPERREFRQERGDFRQERRQDRSELRAGRVDRQAFRADRQAYRADRPTPQRAMQNDRTPDRRVYGQQRHDARRDGVGANRWQQGRVADRSVRIGERYGQQQRWSRDWRQNRRYDYNRYRAVNGSAYRLPRYYAPYGWNGGYRRFGIGFTLSSALFGQNYWLNDPWSYRLPEVDGPYRWVRYYNDALLVDVYTGEVVDTVYDLFW